MGDIIDGYELLRPLGEGGSGAVWEARAPTGIRVAFKLLHASSKLGQAERRRLEREARALNGIDHPSVVKVHDFGVHEDKPYLVMELLEGATLESVLASEPNTPQGLSIARRTVDGLAAVHRAGVLHRDVKPANVLVTFAGVKLVDFGLAKFVDERRWGEHSVLTAANTQLGTPAYMAPEVCFGEVADMRSDVYSAGMLVYECVAGRPPFEGKSRVEWVRHHASTSPPPMGAHVDPHVESAVFRALAKTADERFATATEFALALNR